MSKLYFISTRWWSPLTFYFVQTCCYLLQLLLVLRVAVFIKKLRQ